MKVGYRICNSVLSVGLLCSKSRMRRLIASFAVLPTGTHGARDARDGRSLLLGSWAEMNPGQCARRTLQVNICVIILGGLGVLPSSGAAAVRVTLLFVTVSVAFAATNLPPSANRKIDFEKDVQPILAQKCYSCMAKTSSSPGSDSTSARRSGAADYGPVINVRQQRRKQTHPPARQWRWWLADASHRRSPG